MVSQKKRVNLVSSTQMYRKPLDMFHIKKTYLCQFHRKISDTSSDHDSNGDTDVYRLKEDENSPKVLIKMILMT